MKGTGGSGAASSTGSGPEIRPRALSAAVLGFVLRHYADRGKKVREPVFVRRVTGTPLAPPVAPVQSSVSVRTRCPWEA